MKQPNGIKYGKGLFETIKIKNSELIYFDDHISRLKNSMEFLRISPDNLEMRIENNIKEIDLSIDGALRIMVTEDFNGYRICMETRPTDYTDEKFVTGLKLKIVEPIRDKYNILNNHKTNNYLLNHELLSAEKLNGYDEIVFLNQDGNVTEGSFTNLFFIKTDKIVTAPIEDGLLPGVYRKNFIKQLFEKDIECEIRHIHCKELHTFDSCICTNSLMEKRFVKSIDDMNFKKTNFTEELLKI